MLYVLRRNNTIQTMIFLLFSGSLMYLNEATLLYNLRLRYGKNKIYVSTLSSFAAFKNLLLSKIKPHSQFVTVNYWRWYNRAGYVSKVNYIVKTTLGHYDLNYVFREIRTRFLMFLFYGIEMLYRVAIETKRYSRVLRGTVKLFIDWRWLPSFNNARKFVAECDLFKLDFHRGVVLVKREKGVTVHDQEI